MATQRLRKQWTAGLNLYFAVWRSSDNKIFDFDDNTFKTVGSATTPSLAASEVTNPGGSAKSHYTASLDLALIAAGLAPVDVFVQPYQRLGGSPAPLTDTALGDPVCQTIRFGMINPFLTCKWAPSLRRELNQFIGSITIEADGQPVALSGVTATMTIRGVVSTIGDAAANWYPDLDGTVTAAGRVEFSRVNPGFEGDRAYNVRWSVVDGAETVTFEEGGLVLS